jgi:HAMP domain-containing protein
VRLAGSPAALEQTSAAGADFLWRAGAVAATAAILLSLVAAFVVSRPLRRIAQGARALAHGDFGYDITVHSHDELGEVSDALEELAAKLHQRLHAAGADRAALRALVDDLPVGVILYAADRSPEVVSGAARLLCGLTPDTEAERCRAIPGLASQAALVEKALHDSQVQEAALALPWLPKAVLRARWIALPRQDGSRQLALAILTSEEKDQADRARAALDEAGQALREGARTLGDASLARRLAAAASACELAADLRPVRPQDVKPAALKDLCEAAMADVAALAADRGVTVELQLAAPQLKVVEAGGRVERALRTLLEHVVQTCARGERVGLRADAADGFVRLCTRGRGGEAAFTAEADLLLRALGGEAGRDGSGERAEAWLKIPRA